MLKGILFDITPTITQSKYLQELLRELELAGIKYTFSSMHAHSPTSVTTTSFSEEISILALPPEKCLVLTDSAAGIRSAQSSNLPCIGYIPPGNSEAMTGAYALFEDFASIDTTYLRRMHAHATGYPAEILTTERLLVREFSAADFPTLYSMCTEASTASCMDEQLSDYETELEKHTAYLHSIYPLFDLALWGVFEKSSGKLIGRAGFSLPDDNSDTFSLGYLIDVPYRKQGYAKECIPALLNYAKEQGYTTISAKIKKENIASRRTLTGCVFPYTCKENLVTGILTYTINLTM